MVTKRQKIQDAAAEAAAPVLADMGLELVDVEFSHRGRDNVLCLYVDRPGGVSLDEIQEASHAVEKSLEVADFIRGSYRLEVSSPGLDRPLKRAEDFRKKLGSRVKLKLFSPLPDGRRHVSGTIAGASDAEITLDPGDAPPLTLPLREISSARPEIDWDELLKKSSGSGRKGSHARRSP